MHRETDSRRQQSAHDTARRPFDAARPRARNRRLQDQQGRHGGPVAERHVQRADNRKARRYRNPHSRGMPHADRLEGGVGFQREPRLHDAIPCGLPPFVRMARRRVEVKCVGGLQP